MWPQLGGHLVVRPYPKPFGQDHEPTGAELGGVTDARGAAAGTERTRGAIAPLVFLFFHMIEEGVLFYVLVQPTSLQLFESYSDWFIGTTAAAVEIAAKQSL